MKTSALQADNTTLGRLMSWYRQHCDGEWENDYGVSVQSCDNPGWWVKVDVVGTELEGKPFTVVARGDVNSLDPKPPWLHCYVADRIFHGLGDSTTLEEILEIFLNWAESAEAHCQA